MRELDERGSKPPARIWTKVSGEGVSGWVTEGGQNFKTKNRHSHPETILKTILVNRILKDELGVN